MTLEKYILKNPYISPKTLLSIIYGLVSGLLYIHEKMYAHMDIKPDNIMISNDGQIKYIDFGLACKLISNSSNSSNSYDSCTQSKYMSVLYGSPDYYRNIIYNLTTAQSNDIWSLGVVIYRLANIGKLPFDYSTDFDIQRKNILTAPKYNSNYLAYPDINAYIYSFLINTYEHRPNIKTQYNTIVTIIHNSSILSETHNVDEITNVDTYINKYNTKPISEYVIW
jgi:serine/threonine protein kinase